MGYSRNRQVFSVDDWIGSRRQGPEPRSLVVFGSVSDETRNTGHDMMYSRFRSFDSTGDERSSFSCLLPFGDYVCFYSLLNHSLFVYLCKRV